MKTVRKMFGDVKPEIVYQTADSIFSVISKMYPRLSVEFDEVSFYTLSLMPTNDTDPDEVQASVNDLDPLKAYMSPVAFGLLACHAEILRDCYNEAMEEEGRIEEEQRRLYRDTFSPKS